MPLLPKVKSLAELRSMARTSAAYQQLAIVAANNLGGGVTTLEQAIRWLGTNADETSERGVVNEVNFCRDLVK